MKKIAVIAAAAICSLALCTPAQAQAPRAEKRFIRVAVLRDIFHLNLKIAGGYEITDAAGKKIYQRGRSLKTTVSSYPFGFLVKGKPVKNTRIFLVSSDPQVPVVINGRKFRGKIQLIRKSNGRVLAINYIELEDYIRGILYHEISHYWPMEAIKAQAIVSRTFALFLIEQGKGKDFDATNDIYSQVYGGKTSERYRTNLAVDQTAGQVIMHKDKFLPAFFHATCAGHTEDAALLWDIESPALKGVACGYCKDSPHFKWHYVLSLEEVAEKLRAAGYKVGAIRSLSVAGRNPSGRVMDMLIVTPEKEIKIPAKALRIAISPNLIRSTNFTVSTAEGDAVFEGTGWGHGVGLCQWGAYFMAKQGKTTQEILSFYYPGTDVKALKF